MKLYIAPFLLCLCFIQPGFSKPLWGYIYSEDQSFKKVLFKIPLVNVSRPDFQKIQKEVEYQYNFRSYVLYPRKPGGFLFADGQDTFKIINLDLASPYGTLFTHQKYEDLFMLYEYFLSANPDPIYVIINYPLSNR